MIKVSPSNLWIYVLMLAAIIIVMVMWFFCPNKILNGVVTVIESIWMAILLLYRFVPEILVVNS